MIFRGLKPALLVSGQLPLGAKVPKKLAVVGAVAVEDHPSLPFLYPYFGWTFNA